jgi:galactonate dehydratase
VRLGPVALGASLQLDACTPNAVIQELSLRIHYNEAADLLDYVVDGSVFDVVHGHMAVPSRPGLGVEIDEERVRAAAEGAVPWHSPVWRNDDGTVAEW